MVMWSSFNTTDGENPNYNNFDGSDCGANGGGVYTILIACIKDNLGKICDLIIHNTSHRNADFKHISTISKTLLWNPVILEVKGRMCRMS